MLSLLYNFFFMPIELIVEVTYSVMHRLLNNTGLAVLSVSIVIQILVLPLYKRADAMQDEERARQKDMEHWVNHIKKTFSGDEKYMMLSTYYREQNYKSWYAIKSSASILLQIPFFTAAYHYLSNLSDLAGEPFLFIRDMSKPDMALNVAGIGINILPVMMTLINILSGIIYTRNLKFREKAQVYGLAVAFLVLLYNSPSGLVLYWTMNNLFSLCKNIVMKLIRWPDKKKTERNGLVGSKDQDKQNSYYKMYISSAILITMFGGLLIPANVISSSATEFLNAKNGPLFLVLHNVSIYAGLFLLWGSVFFAFMNARLRLITAVATFFVGVAGIVNYMLFGNNFGKMSSLFVYEGSMSFSIPSIVGNTCIVLVILAASVYLVNRRNRLAIGITLVVTCSAMLLGIIGMFSIGRQVNAYKTSVEENGASEEKILPVSKNGKNVIVIMLDRAISGYLPYIMDEKPELLSAFDGFTYYPNTLSFGVSTNYGSPALFGGYDYTPEAMNNRPDESLKDKHNEALLLMPILFSENGFDVTVCDPPYAGDYSWIPNLSLYDKYERVNAYITKGRYLDGVQDVLDLAYQPVQRENVFWYSVMRILPVGIQPAIYRNGLYFGNGIELNEDFLRYYSVLLKMSELTEIKDDASMNCIVFQNASTHDTSALEIPEYEPKAGARYKLNEFLDYYANEAFSDQTTGLNFENLNQIKHYQCNVASYKALGEWFDYLRDNDCWDNSRIIIVADHGSELGDLDKTILSEELNIEGFNPLLLVKDFDAKGFSTSDSFMTNADVPALAVDGMLENPINPFTGNAIDFSSKKNVQKVTTSTNISTTKNNGNTFDTSDGVWYEVSPTDIFSLDSWKKVD